MRWSVILWICGLGLLLASCAQPQSGALSPDTRTELDKLADRNIDVREKYFQLSIRLAQIMEETAATENDAAAIGKITEFLSDNDVALSRLSSQFDNWAKHETDEVVVGFITDYNEQTSARKLRQLAPRLHQRFRYEQRYVSQLEELVGFISIRR